MLGLRVDVVTAMVGSIAAGIGVDYSCHFIARRREEAWAGHTVRELARRTLVAVGPPIATNALAVGLGFCVLAVSSLVIIQKFGLLIAATMAYSSFGALVILAALLARGKADNKESGHVVKRPSGQALGVRNPNREAGLEESDNRRKE